MQPADHIKRWFKDAGLTVRQDADERVFKDVAEAQQNRVKDKAPAPPALWRMTMRNPMTKWAVAAAAIVACLVGLPFWKGTGSGVALADVLTRLGQVSAYMYQMSTTATQQTNGQTVNTEIESTILVSQEHGQKMTMEMRVAGSGQPTRSEMYMLPQKKVWYTVMPDQKKYMRMDYDVTQIQQQKQNNDTRALVEMILRCKYRSLGRSVVDGVEVEGFETTDPNYMSGMFGQANVKMWVDVKTQLPVRSEQDTENAQVKMRMVSHSFQWNVPATEADFEPAIPADYTEMVGPPVKLPTISEESAIAGLKLYADLTGRYPEKLDMMGIMSQMGKITSSAAPTEAARRLGQELLSAKTDDERSRKLVDVMLPIQAVSSFHMTLVGGKKEPVYHGETVTPQDADKVLLRWKASDTEYRVIFGDLHTETVSAERLAEIEDKK
jgi:hypothetical protein